MRLYSLYISIVIGKSQYHLATIALFYIVYIAFEAKQNRPKTSFVWGRWGRERLLHFSDHPRLHLGANVGQFLRQEGFAGVSSQEQDCKEDGVADFHGKISNYCLGMRLYCVYNSIVIGKCQYI